MKKVFISYSRADYVDESGQTLDNSQVGAIVNELHATNKIDVWIDVNAKYSGKYFTSVLAKKILWADKILFLSSKYSNESEWVSKEILFAHDNNKEILPVRLDESSYNVDFALILTGIDYIEYFKNPKYKITDIIENILGDSQEIGKVIETPINALSDNPVSNQKERKGCLSLNVNYRGCALAITIAMCLFVVFGIFYKVNEEKEYMAHNEPTQSAKYDYQTELDIEELEVKKAEQEANMRDRKFESSPRQNGNLKQNANLKHSNNPKSKKELAQNKEETKEPKNNDTSIISRNEPVETETYIAQNENKTDGTDAQTHIPSNAVAGNQLISNRVSACGSDSYQITFKGGKLAIVTVLGDGDTDLDVFVYDSKGNLITSNTDSTDDCVMKWTPRWTEKYRIVIKNKGNVYNKYTIRTSQQ